MGGEEFKKFPAKYGPTLEKLLTKLEQDAASQAQNMAVDFLGDLIKIIMGMPIPPAMNDEEMELSNVDSKIGDWFKMVWAKVKAWFQKAGKDIKVFFDDLGEKIKETFEQLFPAELRAKVLAALKAFWSKVVAKVEATFDKYKDLIIDALKKDGKVILEEAERLLTEVVKSATKFIEDLIKKLIGGQELVNDDFVGLFNDDFELADNGINEWWAKVVAEIKKYFVSKGEEFKKFPAKYGPTLEKLLTKLEQDAASQAQNMAVDFLGDLIKIIMGMPIPPAMNDEEMDLSNVDSKIGDWFKMVWAKVKAWFEKAGKDIKVFFDDLGEKIKETFEQLFPAELRAKVLAALKAFWTKVVAKVEATFDKYKDLILDVVNPLVELGDVHLSVLEPGLSNLELLLKIEDFVHELLLPLQGLLGGLLELLHVLTDTLQLLLD